MVREWTGGLLRKRRAARRKAGGRPVGRGSRQARISSAASGLVTGSSGGLSICPVRTGFRRWVSLQHRAHLLYKLSMTAESPLMHLSHPYMIVMLIDRDRDRDYGGRGRDDDGHDHDDDDDDHLRSRHE